MVQTEGKSSGFDYMRLVLAFLIIAFHSVAVCYGYEAQKKLNQSWLGLFVATWLPMFFSLSGFLVAGSLERSRSLIVFLGLRVLRIFPALTIDTLFCALLLGPILTTLALPDYFSDPKLHSYFLNILGEIHYLLPGVFENNPIHEVNGQLWTIPAELECYLALAGLALFGFHKKRSVFLGIFVLLTAVMQVRLWMAGGHVWGERMLVLCFLAGVLIYLYRDLLRWNVYCFFALYAFVFYALWDVRLSYFVALPAAYVTVYIGLQNPTKINFLKRGDYSYGLYLYGFPLQQALVAFLPAMREWYWNILIGFPLALGFAMVSWHFFESRALQQKKHLYNFDAWLSGKFRLLFS